MAQITANMSGAMPPNPGYYDAKFFLRPHFQLEGLTGSLRLVTKLPSVKQGNA